MYKGTLIFIVGGTIGSLFGALAGAVLGFFGGAIFSEMMKDEGRNEERNRHRGGIGRVNYGGMGHGTRRLVSPERREEIDDATVEDPATLTKDELNELNTTYVMVGLSLGRFKLAEPLLEEVVSTPDDDV